MKGLLLTIGLILGALGGAYPRERSMILGIPGGWPLVVAGVALIGIALALRLRGSKVTEAQRGSIGAAAAAIQRVPKEIAALAASAASMPIAELKTRIDAIVHQDFDPVHDAQEALIQAQGFAKYAAHTGPWASGERMVYRAWSAATDGHRPEAMAALREAIPHFEEAAKQFVP